MSEKKRPKVLLYCPAPKDANSFWRAVGPWSYLHRMGEIDVHVIGQELDGADVNWSSVCRYDLLFMHRPGLELDRTLFRIARNLQIPVWVDYDDDLFGIPSWNPNRKDWSIPARQRLLSQFIACSDMVSVSTEQLRQKFSSINANVSVIPNAYRDDLFTYRSPEIAPRNKVIMWRGSNTHDADIFDALSLHSTDYDVEFMGDPGWSFLQTLGTRAKGQTIQTPGMDHLEYFKYIHHRRPKVFIVPLADCFFNHCKTPIAWMEAIHAGAICVAPDFPNWKLPGVVPYTAGDPHSFLNAVNLAMGISEETHADIVSQAFQHVKEHFGVAHVERQRLTVLQTLLHLHGKMGMRNNVDPVDPMVGHATLHVVNNPNAPSISETKKHGKIEVEKSVLKSTTD